MSVRTYLPKGKAHLELTGTQCLISCGRIDLKSGYSRYASDQIKISFKTTFELYEFLVMPFGLTNAPKTFNQLLDRIFRKDRAFIGVFFDDIIVYSRSLEEHKEHLAQVSNELRVHKLYVNMKKIEFFLKDICYLGHIISKDGIRMDPKKLKIK